MKTLNKIYSNTLGTSYNILIQEKENQNLMVLEIHQISFLINRKELKAFTYSTESILNYHAQCTCPKDLENKMVIYQAKQTEIRMMLSYNQLFLLKDLLKGTYFKLSMNYLLLKYKIS